MTGPPETMPWQGTVLIICLIVDIVCLYKILKNGPGMNDFRTWALIIGLGVITYFSVGWIWWVEPTHLNIYVPYDPEPTTHQWGMIIISLAPGSLIAWILEWRDMRNAFGKKTIRRIFCRNGKRETNCNSRKSGKEKGDNESGNRG